MASSTRHFYTDPTALVNAALHAQTRLNPSLQLDLDHRVVYLPSTSAVAAKSSQRVHLLSGGGSGHEPSFAGFVGHGLLGASVAGSIFASPSAKQVSRGIQLLRNGSSSSSDQPSGVCVIVMNYTGDVLNFGLAVEKAKASGENVEMVVVGDDVGVGRSKGGKVGRRGIAGTCLVHKIAGALAASGASLDAVTKAARITADNIVSVGASLSHVHVPGHSTDVASNALKNNEVELGMGIHNEDGSERLVDVQLPELISKMLAQMLDTADKDRAFLSVSAQDDTVLLINNLGGVSPLELAGITDEVASQLEQGYGIQPRRILSGAFMTSLNGLGFSISLLKCKKLEGGQSMIDLLDAPVEAAGWLASIKPAAWATRESAKAQVQPKAKQKTTDFSSSNFTIKYSRSVTALTVALKKVIAAEPEITRYDTVVGDGDCGVGLKRGAQGVLDELNNGYTTTDVVVFLGRIIRAVEKTMDGTSGALYAIFLNALVADVGSQSPANSREMNIGVWAKALEQALLALRKYTPARPGDRTLVDALEPFISSLSHYGSVERAAKAAEEGAQKTKSMRASLGRSVYVGGDGWQEVPDPGAYGLSQLFLGLAQGLK